MLSYILVIQEHFYKKRKKIMTTLIPQQDSAASTFTDDIPVIAQGFSYLNLSENLLKALADMNFTTPSSIQKEAIPQVLSGNDIIAKAPTGSGKTAAFAIPIIEKLDFNPENKTIQALVLCPTRELAIQVHKEFEKLTKYEENVSVVSVYGGQNIERQFNALKKQPQIVVATPGRLMDHLRRGSIKLSFINTVVLDEADEMLDMGFRDDIHTILEDTSENRQTILFSATMAKDILELTKKFQKSPNIVDVTDNLMNTPDIEQQYFEVVERNKTELLTRLLNLHNVRLALVFCNTKSNVDKVVEILKTKGYFADSLHGDMNQAQREKVMRGFRNGTVEILVATDVAGRGIDVKDIEAVFNYDLPRDDEDYIHRIGRTGRAGTSGVAFTFVSRGQVQSLRRIERANGIQIHKKEIPSFEEIENIRTSNFENKIKEIIKNEDLSQYKTKIEAMLSDDISVIDIAATLLKLSVTKSTKKINQDVVFGSTEEDDNERQGHRRGSRGGNRHGGGRGQSNRSFGNRERNTRFSENKERSNKSFDNNEGTTKSFGSRERSNKSFENKEGSNKSFGSRERKPSDNKKKSKETILLDEMIASVKSLAGPSKRKPFKDKFSDKFNKKSKSKTRR